MEPYHFELPSDQYQKKEGKWYWHKYECKGADPGTFTPCNNAWAFDEHGVFRQDKRLRSKHPNDCRVLNLLFAKDREHVYYIEGVAHAVANVDGFRVLDPGRYLREDGSERRFGFATDDQFVYSHEFFSGKPKILKGADVATFRRLAFGFAKDASRAWHESFRIKKADPSTFEPITWVYSRDAKHVYFCESPLEGADPTHFQLLADVYCTDGRSVYCQRGRLEHADPASFRMIDHLLMSRDREHVYSGEELIVGANPDAFCRVGTSHYYRDDKAVYYQTQLAVGADPNSFEQVGDSWEHAKDKDRSYIDGKPQ